MENILFNGVEVTTEQYSQMQRKQLEKQQELAKQAAKPLENTNSGWVTRAINGVDRFFGKITRGLQNLFVRNTDLTDVQRTVVNAAAASLERKEDGSQRTPAEILEIKIKNIKKRIEEIKQAASDGIVLTPFGGRTLQNLVDDVRKFEEEYINLTTPKTANSQGNQKQGDGAAAGSAQTAVDPDKNVQTPQQASNDNNISQSPIEEAAAAVMEPEAARGAENIEEVKKELTPYEHLQQLLQDEENLSNEIIKEEVNSKVLGEHIERETNKLNKIKRIFGRVNRDYTFDELEEMHSEASELEEFLNRSTSEKNTSDEKLVELREKHQQLVKDIEAARAAVDRYNRRQELEEEKSNTQVEREKEAGKNNELKDKSNRADRRIKELKERLGGVNYLDNADAIDRAHEEKENLEKELEQIKTQVSESDAILKEFDEKLALIQREIDALNLVEERIRNMPSWVKEKEKLSEELDKANATRQELYNRYLDAYAEVDELERKRSSTDDEREKLLFTDQKAGAEKELIRLQKELKTADGNMTKISAQLVELDKKING